MKKTCSYIVVCASLVLMGVILARVLPLEQKEASSILSDQAASFASLLPATLLSEIVNIPDDMPAEADVLFASEVLPDPVVVLPLEIQELLAEPVIAQPSVIPQSLVVQIEDVKELPIPTFVAPAPTTVASAPTPIVPAQTTPLPSAPAAPVSYIYFYTGVPVQPAPMSTSSVFYNGKVMSVAVASPVAQTYVAPVFVPQVVPSRVGAPKLVYSNGVVIKPKVYFPNQPLRNTFRGVTP